VQKTHQANVMKQRLVLLRSAVLVSVFLFVLSSPDITAQKNASRKVEKELFGKTGKSKPIDDKVRTKGAAGKAMREQEKKEARRDKEDEKSIEKLRKRHVEIQSPATQERMASNGKKTDANYKAKKKKQRKEQTAPDLNRPEQPKPAKEQAKPKQKKPEQAKQSGKPAKVKQKKPEQPKQSGKQTKAKRVDPKKQPKPKQHKVRKYKN
jgi:hypothetical protein